MSVIKDNSIKWVDNNFKIDETPIELINETKTDGKNIAASIQDCLVRHSLPISECRG